MFLDEPTAGLDVEGRIALHEYIRVLKSRGKTIFLSSHDMAEVESLCDRIAVLKNGCIAFTGTVEELTERIGKHYRIQIKTDQGEEEYESQDIEAALEAILKDCRERKATIEDIRVDRGTLEEHFVELVS